MFEESIDIQGKTYIVGGMIGEGTMGSVASVVGQDGRKYAVKKIVQYGRSPVLKEQVNREIQTQQQFNGNPFIIQIYDSEYLCLLTQGQR